MNREDFIELLSRLVADGEISEAEAVEYLAQFDAGELPVGWTLPLPPAAGGIVGDDEDGRDSAAALVLLLSILGGLNVSGVAATTYAQKIAATDLLQSEFELRARALAARLSVGDISLAEWHAGMISEVRQNAINQMRLAAGRRILRQAQRERLDQLMLRQSAYLQRFADQLASRFGRGLIPSEAQVAMRSALYGGFARAEFFAQAEVEAGYDYGWVFQYIAVDDDRTCGPCLSAEGYYRAGEGPMPGEICLGRSYCRCRREPVFDPQIYAEVQSRPFDQTIR